MFCPKCKSLMYPKNEIYICKKCNYQKKKSGRNIVKTVQKTRDVTIIENNKNNIEVIIKKHKILSSTYSKPGTIPSLSMDDNNTEMIRIKRSTTNINMFILNQ